MGFYGSNDPTNSVKALKEVAVIRTGFSLTRSTSPCHNTTHACYNTYTKMNLSTVKWAQWDKTQSRELLGLFICVCIELCTIVAHNTAQNRRDNFPSTLQTITIAPMMSIWGKGGCNGREEWIRVAHDVCAAGHAKRCRRGGRPSTTVDDPTKRRFGGAWEVLIT